MIEYRKFITRDMLRKEPEKLFVFGDNLERRGMGGQAREMRGEPNAVGIPTKKKPKNTSDAYFNDEDIIDWITSSIDDILRLMTHEGVIVWPRDGIGTGLAKLEEKAPIILERIKTLERILND